MLVPAPQAITATAPTAVAVTGNSQLWNEYSTKGGVAAQNSTHQRTINANSTVIARPNGTSSHTEC